jgi:hypothetical protein
MMLTTQRAVNWPMIPSGSALIPRIAQAGILVLFVGLTVALGALPLHGAAPHFRILGASCSFVPFPPLPQRHGYRVPNSLEARFCNGFGWNEGAVHNRSPSKTTSGQSGAFVNVEACNGVLGVTHAFCAPTTSGSPWLHFKQNLSKSGSKISFALRWRLSF